MAAKNTSTIDAESTVVTLINVYEVAPDRQAELARLIAEATDSVMRRLPGFVSANIHCSLDGTRVANYAQWASKEDFDRMLKNPDAEVHRKQFAAVAKGASPVLYKVTTVHPRAS
jgi:hypothetical protein